MFESLFSRYIIGLGTQMRGINVIFDCVNRMYYNCHKTTLNVVVHILILRTGEKRKK